MKKIGILFLCLISVSCFLSLTGCKKDEGLAPFVSELRSEIYNGQSDSYQIRASYGFREEPFTNDGSVGEKVYRLTFRMTGLQTDNTERTVFLTYKGVEYKSVFSLNPVSDMLTATLEIEDFSEKEFSAVIFAGSAAETITFKSIIPENALNYRAALALFEKNQPALADSFKDENGNFCAEIYARIIFKDEKPFWYIGFASGNNRIKALLLDGVTGEVLATRDVL